MSILILKPTECEAAYSHAAEIIQHMYAKITGISLPVSETDDFQSDLFVIGSDSVNDFVMNEVLEGNIETLGIRYGTDDYCLLSYQQENRRILILAGGRARSTIYAVYDFFERFADCHYFWDGDVIPRKNGITFGDFHICETPRFEYRGLRYFAHRGLKRFQAEHWSFDDWKIELDWMMKKRLNFFMLRIGMDDVWQRAFPDIVDYPETYQIIKDEKGFDDRSDFWTLRYRGELREKVLAYARELDIIYPTDCGTMTHWYSRTPNTFLEKKKPSFLPQSSKNYVGFDTGKVWDFRKKENMRNYMHLTQTMVNEYEKRTDYFHTIGLGERSIYADPKKNLALKLVAYRRTAEELRRRFPNSKLFLASWDFVGWWKSEDVQKLIGELDPDRTIILDYTSEVNDPEQSFLHWGVVKKFPWIFGLFHAYESESELRGPYKRTEERLKVAVEDPYCKGMILWPELSHSDPIVLEYLSENAWSPLKNTIEETVTGFCKNRYGTAWSRMDSCWQKFLPFMMMGDWGGYSVRDENDPMGAEYYNSWFSHNDLWTKTLTMGVLIIRDNMRYCKQSEQKICAAKAVWGDVIDVIETLAGYDELWTNTFFKRDAIDIIRTAAGRALNFLIISAMYDENTENIKAKKTVYIKLLDALRNLLGLHDDFSVYKTLQDIQAAAPTNPDFERTLKENICDRYCRQFAYELMDPLFRKESNILFDWLINGKKEEKIQEILEKGNKLFSAFLDTPLSDMKPSETYNPTEVALQVAECLKEVYHVL